MIKNEETSTKKNLKKEEEDCFAFLKSDFDFDCLRIYTECETLPNECEEVLFYHNFFLGHLAEKFTIYKLKNSEKAFYIKIFDKIFEIESKSFNKADIKDIISYEIKENPPTIQKRFFTYPSQKRDYTDYRYAYVLFANKQKQLLYGFEEVLKIVSHTFRNSDTLDKTERNYMHTKSIEMLIDSSGVYCDCVYILQRLRILMVFCLLIYYISTTKDYIKKLASYKNLEDIIKIRKELLEYDVRYFYKNPIIQSRYELYAIYELMAKNHNLIHLYEEMKAQTKDIAKIAEIELSEKKANQYKKLKTMINWIVILVTIMGALPAIDSAINIYNRFFD